MDRSQHDIVEDIQVLEKRMRLEYHPNGSSQQAEPRLGEEWTWTKYNIIDDNLPCTEWLQRSDRS
jgi:hypothetical protein